MLTPSGLICLEANLFMKLNLYLLNVQNLLASADIFNIGHRRMLLALEYSVNLFQRLALCLYPKDGLNKL